MTSVETGAPRILLAEDNPADVYLIERALHRHGVAFHMELADGGKRALALLRRYDDGAPEPPPSLIVLDLNLPQHDGIEILRYIRQTSSISSVPVVVLTSSDSPRDQMLSLESGATRFVKKPSSLEEFMRIGAVLKELLDPPQQLAASN